MIIRLLFCWPTVGFFSGALITASVSSGKCFATIEHSDKILHFMAYGVLTVIVLMASPMRTGIGRALCASAYSFLLGLGLECVQAYLPFRSFEVVDLCANTLGIMSAVIFSPVVFRVYERIMAKRVSCTEVS